MTFKGHSALQSCLNLICLLILMMIIPFSDHIYRSAFDGNLHLPALFFPVFVKRFLMMSGGHCSEGLMCCILLRTFKKTPKVVSLQFFWSSCPENYFQPFWLCGGKWEQELLLWPWALLAFWFVVSLRQLEKATFFNSYLVLHQAPQV